MTSDYRKVSIKGGFWKSKEDLNRDVTNKAVYDRFYESGRIGAFDFNDPNCHIYWDSDVAKWMEAAAYILYRERIPELEEKVETLIDKIIEHQGEDGYFNIHFTVAEPDKRWSNRDWCELYDAGHLIEAACAYYEATGRDRFLIAMEKYADCIARVFTVEHSAAFRTPGSEEIELALYRLYRLTGEKRFYNLMQYFLETRGQPDNDEQIVWHPMHIQAHLPIREQHDAVGHAVRAVYLYTAMADYAAESGDKVLLQTCRDLFDDISKRKMYITGGIGSTYRGEAFTVPYDLPNDKAYTETCAALGLMFFANHMIKADPNHTSEYADVIETVMYNGALSGLSLDGEKFFYENPLEINLSDRRRFRYLDNPERYPASQRVKLFECSCCPPNITRVLASLGEYFYSFDEETGEVYVNQFGESEYTDGCIRVSVKTRYPLDGRIEITSTVPVNVRIPGWCHSFRSDSAYKTENGYAKFGAGNITIDIDIRPELIMAHPFVISDIGKAALRRGPVVYCAEAVDNGGKVHNLVLDRSSVRDAVCENDVSGLPALIVDGAEFITDGSLYSPLEEHYRSRKIRMIPYYSFANRGECDMLVFMPYR